MTRKPFILIAALTGLLLQSCAHISRTPDIEQVDRVFTASAIKIEDLNNTATDIKTRHATGDITILVRYFLQQPFSASKELAYTQGATVKKFLQEHDIKVPIHVLVSPYDERVNRIWISYQADRNKGRGIYMQENAAE